MKRIITLFILGFISLSISQAKPVDPNKARTAGLGFLSSVATNKTFGKNSNLELVYTASAKATNAASKAPDYFYVFHTGQAQGFVIIAADDDVQPVLAYSNEGNFDAAHIPQSVSKWLDGYKAQIRFVRDNHIPATAEISKAWAQLYEGNANSTASANAVSPLVQTKWNQNPNYNALCPYNNAASQRTVTGCVATAMAQVMKYWDYPTTGSGFHSYNHSTYGTLSANFGATTYDWASMPNTISGSNTAIATLMYHAGVSVDMNYGIASAGGSGAYVISAASPVTHCSEYALKNYFGYKNTMQGLLRDDYTESQWMVKIKGELDASRPVIYVGFGSAGGHCFVADGYDNNSFIHFNWGWGGNSDGYFQINALNPAALGTGGGGGGFNSGHQAIIGIEPGSTSAPSYSLKLNRDVTPSAYTLGYGQGFSINTNILNSGTGSFSGDYAAAVFDEDGIFVEYVEIKTGMSLPGGYTYQSPYLTFTTAGNLAYLPGYYDIYILYRPTGGGSWQQLSGTSSSIDEYTSIHVIYSSNIELNSSMTVTPSTVIKGQSASVKLNLLNAGTGTFTGQYGVGIFKLDGSLVQTVALVDENNGLPSGYTYQSPYLTFNTAAVTAEPGTYLLAVQHKPTGGNWQLSGSTNFTNPVKITVIEPPYPADIYEINDNSSQAYNLSLSYNSSNVATKTTAGSNCHNGTDYDYYKISLEPGYKYTVTARIHDAGNSGNSQTYTLDGLLTYSTDATNWSDAFDYNITDVIQVNGAGTVYFFVSPYFTGETGTYLLDFTVTRSFFTSVNEAGASADQVKLYPNPARDIVHVDLAGFKGKTEKVQLFDIRGQEIQLPEINDDNHGFTLHSAILSNGVYVLRLSTSEGIISKKLVIRK